jgi:DNA helicase II / ATP-dependent DNA helicase PcrA
MKNSNLIIAAAGSGKTTYLVTEALKIKDENVLLTTFTDANEEKIKEKFTFINRVIPSNITIQTWFSFLIQHGVKPYRGGIFEEPINGLCFFNGRSSIGVREADTRKYYLDHNNRIYSDKLSQFTLKCNSMSKGSVIKRISKIFPFIFIDEVQDLSGYDLDILKLLFDSSCQILLVGDPRQGTYSTSNSAKYNKYSRSNIVYFFESPEVQKTLNVDTTSLQTNHRSNQQICDFSNKLFPQYQPVNSGQKMITGHDGVFLVREQDIEAYLSEYATCIQLRYNIKEPRVKKNHDAINFGNSKGLEFDRVLIYPTESFLEWIKNSSTELAQTSRCKFYVAVTRARYSVGIIYNYKDNEVIEGTEKYQPRPL